MIVKQHKGYLRLISFLTLAFFISSQSVWALPQPGISVTPQRETPSFLQIEIPQELASVEEVYEAPAKVDPKLILHIQNVHGNYESQLQIKKLLDYLYQKYGFKLLFAEGAAEKLNPDLLRFFPDAQRNQRFAEYMAKKGQLTGIEYYLMNGPGDVEAVGIEEKELYRQNYEAFRKVYGAKEEVNLFLDTYEGQLEVLSSRIFPQNTRRLLSEWRKFESGHRDFLPYIQRLAVDAKSVLGIDLQSLFSQVEWPQITRLLALQSMEKEMDRAGAEKEKARLLEFLKMQQAAPELITAIEKLTEQRITMERLTDSEKKLEDLPRYLLERLVNELGPKGFRFHDYPAFSLWAGYLILQNELDSRLLFEEIEKVFGKVLDEMSVTEREKNLLELYRDAVLLRKLLHLELSRKEWDRVLYRKDWISFSAMEGRLKKIAVEAEGGLEEEKSLDFKELTQILNTSYDFYDFARKRESAFYDKIQAEMNSRKTEKAILVTGGFHTDGLMEIFREKEINCGVLMPRMNGAIDTEGYVSGMLENNPTMFDLATIEFNNAMQNLLTRTDLGANAWATVTERLNDFVAAGVYKDADDMIAVLNSDNRGPFANLGFELVRSEEGPIAIRIVNNDLSAAINTAGQFGLDDQDILTALDGTLLAMKVLPVESEADQKAGYNFIIGPLQKVRNGESLTLPEVAVSRSESRDKALLVPREARYLAGDVAAQQLTTPPAKTLLVPREARYLAGDVAAQQLTTPPAKTLLVPREARYAAGDAAALQLRNRSESRETVSADQVIPKLDSLIQSIRNESEAQKRAPRSKGMFDMNIGSASGQISISFWRAAVGNWMISLNSSSDVFSQNADTVTKQVKTLLEAPPQGSAFEIHRSGTSITVRELLKQGDARSESRLDKAEILTLLQESADVDNPNFSSSNDKLREIARVFANQEALLSIREELEAEGVSNHLTYEISRQLTYARQAAAPRGGTPWESIPETIKEAASKAHRISLRLLGTQSFEPGERVLAALVSLVPQSKFNSLDILSLNISGSRYSGREADILSLANFSDSQPEMLDVLRKFHEVGTRIAGPGYNSTVASLLTLATFAPTNPSVDEVVKTYDEISSRLSGVRYDPISSALLTLGTYAAARPTVNEMLVRFDSIGELIAGYSYSQRSAAILALATLVGNPRFEDVAGIYLSSISEGAVSTFTAFLIAQNPGLVRSESRETPQDLAMDDPRYNDFYQQALQHVSGFSDLYLIPSEQQEEAHVLAVNRILEALGQPPYLEFKDGIAQRIDRPSSNKARLSLDDYLDILRDAEQAAGEKAREIRGGDDGLQNDYAIAQQSLTDQIQALQNAVVPANADNWWALPTHADEAIDSILLLLYGDALGARSELRNLTYTVAAILGIGIFGGLTGYQAFFSDSAFRNQNIAGLKNNHELVGSLNNKILEEELAFNLPDMSGLSKADILNLVNEPFTAANRQGDSYYQKLSAAAYVFQHASDFSIRERFAAAERLHELMVGDGSPEGSLKTVEAAMVVFRYVGAEDDGLAPKAFGYAKTSLWDEAVEVVTSEVKGTIKGATRPEEEDLANLYASTLVLSHPVFESSGSLREKAESKLQMIAGATILGGAGVLDAKFSQDARDLARQSLDSLGIEYSDIQMNQTTRKSRSELRDRDDEDGFDTSFQDQIDYNLLERRSRFSPNTRAEFEREIIERIDHGLPLPLTPNFTVTYSDEGEEPSNILVTFPAIAFNQHEQTLKTLRTLGDILTKTFGVNPETKQSEYEAQVVLPAQDYDPEVNYGAQKVQYGISFSRSETRAADMRIEMNVQKAGPFVDFINHSIEKFSSETDWKQIAATIDPNPFGALHKLILELLEDIDTKRGDLKAGRADSLDLMMIVGAVDDINKLITGGQFDFTAKTNAAKGEVPYVFVYKPHVSRSEARTDVSVRLLERQIHLSGIPVRFQIVQGEDYWNIALDNDIRKALPGKFDSDARYPGSLVYNISTVNGTERGSFELNLNTKSGRVDMIFEGKVKSEPVRALLPQITRFIAEEIFNTARDTRMIERGRNLESEVVHVYAGDAPTDIPTRFELAFSVRDSSDRQRFQFVITPNGLEALKGVDGAAPSSTIAIPFEVFGTQHSAPIGTLNFVVDFFKKDGELRASIERVRVPVDSSSAVVSDQQVLKSVQQDLHHFIMSAGAFSVRNWDVAPEYKLVPARSEVRPISADIKWVTGTSVGNESGAYRIQIDDKKLVASTPQELARTVQDALSVLNFKAAAVGDEITFTAMGQNYGPVNFRDESGLDAALKAAVTNLRSEARLPQMPRRDFLASLIAGAATMTAPSVSGAGQDAPVPTVSQNSDPARDAKILALAQKAGITSGNTFVEPFSISDIDDTLRKASDSALTRHFAWRSLVMDMVAKAREDNFSAVNTLSQIQINDLARHLQTVRPRDIAAAALGPIPEMDSADLRRITLFRNPNTFLNQYALAMVKLELGNDKISELPKLLDPVVLNSKLAFYILPGLTKIGINDPNHPRAISQREELLYLLATVPFNLETNKVSPVITRNGDPAALINANLNFTIADWLQHFAFRKTAQNLADQAAAILVDGIVKADPKAFNLRKQGIDGTPEVKDRTAREQILAEVFPYRIESGDISYVIEQLTKLNEQYRAITNLEQAAAFQKNLGIKLNELKNSFVKALVTANPESVGKYFPVILNNLEGYNLHMLVSQRADVFETKPAFLQLVLKRDPTTLEVIAQEIKNKNTSFPEPSLSRLQRVIQDNPIVFQGTARSEARTTPNGVQVTVAGTPAFILNIGATSVGDRLKPTDTIPALVGRLSRTIQNPQQLENIKQALISPQLISQVDQLPAARDIHSQRKLLLTALSEIKPAISKTSSPVSQQILDFASAIPVGADSRAKYFAEAENLGLSNEQLVAILAGLTFANATIDKLTRFVQQVMQSGINQEEAVQRVLSDNLAVQMTPSSAPAAITVVLDLSLQLGDSEFLNDDNGLFESVAAVLKPYKNAAVTLIVITEKSETVPAIYQQKIQALQTQLAMQNTEQKRIHLKFATLGQLSSRLTDARQDMKIQGPLTKEQRSSFTDFYAEVHISTDDFRLREMTDKSSASPENRFEVVVDNLKNSVSDSVTSTWITLLKPLNLMKQAEELITNGKLIEYKSGRYFITPAARNSISSKLESVIQALMHIDTSA